MVKVQLTGKKKTAIASATISLGKHSFTINDIPADEYLKSQKFGTESSLLAFHSIGLDPKKHTIIVKVLGGGLSSQVFAIKHAIAKTLAKFYPEQRTVIKKTGMLTRDARIVERKKPGLRKARRKEQFSKR